MSGISARPRKRQLAIVRLYRAKDLYWAVCRDGSLWYLAGNYWYEADCLTGGPHP